MNHANPTHRPPDATAAAVIRLLGEIGYRGAQLQKDYAFADWFDQQHERVAVAAAFGQTPVSYDSACIGVVRANGLRERALVSAFRALGAPILLEIDETELREWAVSREPSEHALIARYPLSDVGAAFVQRGPEWRPDALLRAKNIGLFRSARQLSLFSGLVPELETQIHDQLAPLLEAMVADTRDAYVDSSGRQPTPEQLFKLVFWLLTAKVFHDRDVSGFVSGSDSDEMLAAVAHHYKMEAPKLLNRAARETAAAHVWGGLDFRNLSVEVLSQIWASTLVDKATRKRLGIHRTSRSIVRYVVDKVPFSPAGDDGKIVYEPCSGSAAFLIGAMHALRQTLFGTPPQERHRYFTKRLEGAEYDPFGVEISTLALTLADFPNPTGWQVKNQDIFVPGVMSPALRRAGVVLCNPPFEPFEVAERKRYQSVSAFKPVELLNRVLDDLHPDGVLGFVLPYVAVDGKAYRGVRERLARRFASIDLTVLPDRAFQVADAEVALLVATDPIPHDLCRVAFRRVNDDALSWSQFEREHLVSTEYGANFGAAKAAKGFTIPSLQEVWTFLADYPQLGNVADIHRGLQWKRPNLFQARSASGYRVGVAPKTKFNVFEVPQMRFLSIKPEDQARNSYLLDWGKPKAIFNKSARSRGAWKLAAFPDRVGVACFQTFFAAWPKLNEYDEVVISAVLNSPLANAFVATREGKTDITKETLSLLPMPLFTDSQVHRLHGLVEQYQALISDGPFFDSSNAPHRVLLEIDALVLDGYRMPARLERQVLNYFAGQGPDRKVSHDFRDYIPADVEVNLSLSEYLDNAFMSANVGAALELIKSRR